MDLCIPARIALENKDWKSAAELQLSPIVFPWNHFPWQKSIFHFTRALGACHLQDQTGAKSEIDILQTLYTDLSARENKYEANQVLIQIKASQTMLAYTEGDVDRSEALMREAADMEDGTSKHPTTPCEVLPARELLADLLMDINKPEEALVAYENDLINHPGRFNGNLWSRPSCTPYRRPGKSKKVL